MKKLYYISLAGLLLSTLIYSSCKKVLADKQPLTTYTGQLLFSDSTVAVQYMNTLYTQNLPTWYGSNSLSYFGNTIGLGNASEENYSANAVTQGTVTAQLAGDIGSSNANNNNYGKIYNINDFIGNLATSPMPVGTKQRFKAQAYFWRAWRYFDLARVYGGVPLVLTTLPVVGDAAKLADQLPRSTTTQTFNQIVADLDTAIKYLPGTWPAVDYGRITKGAAQAFLGRVLLTWASPEFNPSGDQTRWQAAYQASTDAIATLSAHGNGLYPTWDVTMWTKEGANSNGTPANPEAVMVTEFNTAIDAAGMFNNTYTGSSIPKSLNGSGGNNPTWNEVAAFPMADGKDPHDPTGKYYISATNPWDSVHFYKNRDPRFAQTIAYNGCSWPLESNSTYRLWTYYYYSKATATTTTEVNGASSTGFYCRKGVDPNISASNLTYSGTDWQEIRYAEVLLNQAEAAAMIGNSNVAYTDLQLIRSRAGLPAGSDGNYGVTSGLSGTNLAMAVLHERQIELAYEGKRFYDLRRWMLLDDVMNKHVVKRLGLTVVLKPNSDGTFTDYLATAINSTGLTTRDDAVASLGLDSVYDTYFTYVPMIVSNSASTPGELKYMDQTPIAIQVTSPASIYFMGIPLNAMQSDTKLQQNNTWGGPFDPTK